MENLREVQRVWSGTSDWFVPEPPQRSVQADLIIYISIMKNVVWWKSFWCDQKQSTKNERPEEEENIFKATGLNTGLKPTFGLKTAKHRSDNLEGFLTVVEGTLLKKAF